MNSDVKYLFVDGGYFRKVLEKTSIEFFSGLALPVDYSTLARGFTKAFYYDCLSPRSNSESDEQYQKRLEKQREDFINLRLLNGWHVVEGVVVGKGKKARQKQVDIQIAVDMLTHSFRRNMDRIAFIAGDQDFKPLIDSIVREGMFIELWYEKSSASDELVYSSDARYELSLYQIHQFLTRDFQKENALPKRFSQPEKDVSNCNLVGFIETERGKIEVYKSDSDYRIIDSCSFNDGYMNHMIHTKYDFLKKVYESVYSNKGLEWPKI